LSISEEDLKGAIDEIVRLNPKPGGQIDDSYTEQAQQVVPDFVLEYKEGELVMTMPRFSVPELKINKRYADMLMKSANNDKAGKEAATFVKQKLDSAKWFVEAIRQRHNTLNNTMNAIIDFQREFFIDGDETKLKPMVLKNIAEKTNLDISTISRVVNCKYIQTHFGIYPLKYFFSEGLMTESGEEVSTREIKNILVESIDAEDKRKPLTDEELVSVLGEKGYKVARRTVAKYREQLNIPIARLRKEL
jgi:RNA polymerase sigma-54 factor